ncbi:MAG: hypothetical protein AB7C97_08425 [Oscillospiraceae bacterium]
MIRKGNKVRKQLLITLSVAITLLIIVISASAYYSSLADPSVEDEAFTSEDTAKADDLATISGLDSKTVLGLYNANGDWDKVIENILVYKEIFAYAEELGASGDDVLRLAAEYEPDAILTVLEYASEKLLSIGKVEAMLSKNKDGSELELVLSVENEADASYKTYLPADKEQIRAWLKDGWQPSDILSADSIARENDLTLEYVFSLKSEENTWEEVGDALSIEQPERGKTAATDKNKAGKAEETDGSLLEETVPSQSEEAKEKTKEKENGIYEDLTEAGVDADKYLAQGFNINEVQNARRLSEASGTDMETILAEKTNGKTWPEILSEYTRKEVAPQ